MDKARNTIPPNTSSSSKSRKSGPQTAQALGKSFEDFSLLSLMKPQGRLSLNDYKTNEGWNRPSTLRLKSGPPYRQHKRHPNLHFHSSRAPDMVPSLQPWRYAHLSTMAFFSRVRPAPVVPTMYTFLAPKKTSSATLERASTEPSLMAPASCRYPRAFSTFLHTVARDLGKSHKDC